MTEENVYGQEKGTEEIATASMEKAPIKEDEKKVEKASAVPEKFKDVDALVRAYTALQSEFTRRSQRLKELEKTVENFQAEARGENSGAEKLRKNAAARRRAAKAFDDFVAVVEGSDEGCGQDTLKPTGEEAAPMVQTLEDTTKIAQSAKTVSVENGTEKAEESRLREVGRTQGGEGNEPDASVHAEKRLETARQPVANSGDAALIPSEELYRNAVNNETVRLRIIGEYLASIGRSAPPLTTGNVGTLTTPSQKARTIGAASAMALQYLKND